VGVVLALEPKETGVLKSAEMPGLKGEKPNEQERVSQVVGCKIATRQ